MKNETYKVSRDGGNTKLPWTVYRLKRTMSGHRYWGGVGNFKTKAEADAEMKRMADSAQEAK